ncbi:MAG: LuxR C-terminal-related transcriptional regulator [Candidatus Nanopelagicales bacterium]
MVTLVERTSGPAPLASGKTRFTALVVSSDAARRGALCHRLRQYGARTILEAGSQADALFQGRTDGQHDLCIVDGTSAEGPILPLVGELRTMRWRRVLILTPRNDRYAVKAALAASVRGYVVSSRSNLSQIPRNVIPIQRGRARTSPDELSPREIEVLQSVAEGHSNKGIGDELGLSALTVKSHLARIARKLGTGDRAEMVALAMRSGLVR